MTTEIPSTIRIATRASQLALWQAHHTAKLLSAASPGLTVEIVHVTTTGDRVQTEALSQFGGMGVFTREVQLAVIDGRADLAVHSLKDLPTEVTPGLLLGAVLQREVRFDALILPASSPGKITSLAQLPAGSRIGTGSLRRQAQLRHQKPDWQIEEIRGNVDTRLRKLDQGDYDAIILAAAGLIRLGLSERIGLRLEPPLMYPAVGQGAIGIECRSEDVRVQSLLKTISDATTRSEVLAERSLLATLRAGCHAPLGVLTQQVETELKLDAVVLSPDGRQKWSACESLPIDSASLLGQRVAQQLLDAGAGEVLHS